MDTYTIQLKDTHILVEGVWRVIEFKQPTHNDSHLHLNQLAESYWNEVQAMGENE